MSSYSFSHQFYQRWTRAPDQVRAAIVQELTDITTLLQTDTPIEAFTFSLPDLDAHLDQLYSVHEAEQATAKEIADKEAKRLAAVEQQRLAAEKNAAQEKVRAAAKLEREEADAKRQEENAQKEKEQQETARKVQLEADNNNSADVMTSTLEANSHDSNMVNHEKNSVDENNTNAISRSHPEHIIVKPKKGAAVDLSLKDPALSAAHEDLIHELEVHVEDYLSEQMMQMSEDLKSWLRSEVGRQLSELTKKDPSIDSMSQKKSG